MSGAQNKIVFTAEQQQELDRRRDLYREAVEQWIQTIREEEALARPDHSMAAVEAWEHAHFQEEDARTKAKQARQDYQDELRRILFNF
jgi:hypothetical protein